ncbi:MAG: hypothetical protein RRY34_05445 [Victivallaceae bacterium]
MKSLFLGILACLIGGAILVNNIITVAGRAPGEDTGSTGWGFGSGLFICGVVISINYFQNRKKQQK